MLSLLYEFYHSDSFLIVYVAITSRSYL